MSRSFADRFPRVALLAVGVISLAGCEQGKIYVIGQVSGRVTLDDQPAQEGCVLVFHPITGDGINQGIAVVKEDGAYTLTYNSKPGVPVGDYVVSINPPPADPESQKEADAKNSATIMTALTTRNAKNVKKDLVHLQTDIVPMSYRAQGTTPLKVTVEAGENIADLAMDSKSDPSK